MGECGFEGVVGAQDVDVDDGFHGVGTEGGDGGEEVACCAGATGRKALGMWLKGHCSWTIAHIT